LGVETWWISLGITVLGCSCWLVKCGDLSRSGEFSFAPGVLDSC